VGGGRPPDREHRAYDFEAWRYSGGDVSAAAGRRDRVAPGKAHPNPDRDETLTSPRCVFQVLKRHFARYTPEMVEQACGVPPDAFARVCELVTENSGPERTTALVYSVGWTQHTVGVQYIRTAAILQLLLGNIGRPGGGILALRGHASIQGSTDIPTLFDLLPGYLPMPHVHGNEDLATYVHAESTDKGFWANVGSYTVSLLKSWWGDAATQANDFCFDYLPRLTGSHGIYEIAAAQLAGTCRGYPDGKAWSERKALVWWDDEAGQWTGHDVPDFIADRPPSYRPADDATGVDALSGVDPFILQADGKGWLFAPAGLVDGPLPAHYEPQESPFVNPLYGQQRNPVRDIIRHRQNPLQPAGSEPGADVFPYVATTYRLTEHQTAGGMSRTLPYLSELQPEFFCEVSPELAAERDLSHLGWATIITARTAIEARVLVTERIRVIEVQGRRLHQIGLPYHWGVNGLSTGDSANNLTHLALDPNVHIQETKALACDIRPGRRPRGPALRQLVREYADRAGITEDTGTQL